jgi:hypothetical protein
MAVLEVHGACTRPEGVISDGKLEVVVLFTTVEATQFALRSAGKLAEGLSAKIRLLVPSIVPYPLALTQPPVSQKVLGDGLLDIVQQADVPCTIDIRLCRDRCDAIEQALPTRSLVVIGRNPRPRWWQRAERKLAERLIRDGHQIAYAD